MKDNFDELDKEVVKTKKDTGLTETSSDFGINELGDIINANKTVQLLSTDLEFDLGDDISDSSPLEQDENILYDSHELSDSEVKSMLDTSDENMALEIGETFYKKIKGLSFDDLNDERKRLIELGILDDE